MQIPKYMAFDPGKTTGYAYFDKDGTVLSTGQLSLPQLQSTLTVINGQIPPDTVFIVEEFKLLPKFARKVASNPNSRSMETSQVIGFLRMFAQLNNAKFVLQRPDNGATAKYWTGLDPDVNHAKSHWKSAYNHAIYYLVMIEKLLKVDQVRAN